MQTELNDMPEVWYRVTFWTKLRDISGIPDNLSRCFRPVMGIQVQPNKSPDEPYPFRYTGRPTMQTKWTPGTWKAAPFRLTVGDRQGPLMSYLVGDRSTGQGMTVSIASERVADHYLCAAAPAMYEALRALVADLSQRRNVSAETLAPARAALAAAEGEA